MDKVIPALIVAAISSVTFIAYKHPKAYENLYPLFSIALLVAMSAVIAWDSAIYFYSFPMDSLLIEAGKFKEAAAITERYRISPGVFLSLIGLQIYTIALTQLPKLLEEDKPEEKQHKKK